MAELYVKKDATGKIQAVSREPLEGFSAMVVEGSGDLEALGRPASRLQESDLELVRVLEDLVDLLVARQVIRFTDLPEAAREKLLGRRSLRCHLQDLDLLVESQLL